MIIGIMELKNFLIFLIFCYIFSQKRIVLLLNLENQGDN